MFDTGFYLFFLVMGDIILSRQKFTSETVLYITLNTVFQKLVHFTFKIPKFNLTNAFSILKYVQYSSFSTTFTYLNAFKVFFHLLRGKLFNCKRWELCFFVRVRKFYLFFLRYQSSYLFQNLKL